MKKLDKNIYSFTKLWVGRLLIFFMACIASSYVLAFIGREQTLESLSQTVMTAGMAVFLGYLLKSFFETFSEEHNKLKERLHNSEKVAQTGDMEPTEAEEGEEQA